MKKRIVLHLSCLLMAVLLHAQDSTKVATSAASPPSQAQEEIFKVVEEAPCFPGCEAVQDKAAKKKCAEERMLNFIYSNLKYPDSAVAKSVEGSVYVKFAVEKDGSITNAEIIRDIGAGCGQEARRIVGLMPKWNPGKQRGRPVRVQFNLPIRFELEDGKPVRPAPVEKPAPKVVTRLPVSEEITDDKIYEEVEVKPMYAGCEDVVNKSEHKRCAETKMLQFIYSNIRYPREAVQKKIQGTVYIKFVVEKDGSITNATIDRNVGGGCGEEALRVIKSLPKFNPALIEGKPVRAYFNMPVAFKLQ